MTSLRASSILMIGVTCHYYDGYDLASAGRSVACGSAIVATALTHVLERPWRADEGSPSAILAILDRRASDGQRCCWCRVAAAGALIGEIDGCGVTAGAEAAGVHGE